MRPGDLVECRLNDLGAAKAVRRLNDGRIEIEYFDHVGQDPTDRHREYVPLDSLRHFQLGAETRVYWQTEAGEWLAGEVLVADPDRRYVIVEQYRRLDHNLREAQLYVRWNRPLTDVLGLGIARAFASPYFMQLRQPFLQHMLIQRAAARGVPAIPSSVIHLYQHQLDVARRILSDPIQRYLLADEVGLGKTIEAGLVLRQLLLDRPTRHALVITPTHLEPQWREELRLKFLVNDFPRDAVQFASNEDPASWTSADIVIVDEAHHLASWHEHQDQALAERYKVLCKVVHDSPRLLLLSATPLLHHERTFLAMLHLLDPQLFRLNALDEFHKLVEERRPLGLLTHALDPDTPSFVLRRKIPELRALLSSDDILAQYLDAADAALLSGDGSGLALAIERARIHITEVHRLHRRLLRTRRSAALAATFPLAGRTAPRLLPVEEHIARRLDQVVDEWRQVVAGSIAESNDAMIDHAAALLADLVESAVDAEPLAAWADRRKASPGLMALTDDERAVLDRMASLRYDLSPESSRAHEVLEGMVTDVRVSERTVVFTHSTIVARMVIRELSEHLRRGVVAHHLLDDDPSVQTRALRDFELNRARILVCDQSAEEGHNFQFADLILHVDLPSDPNRLEQRIGRLDRWHADGTTGRSLLTADPPGSGTLWDAWRRILTDGFGVFNQSIATLQHVVDQQTREAWRGLLLGGAASATALSGTIRAALEAERDNVAQLDALDSIEASDEDRDFLRELRRSESMSPIFAQVTDRLLTRQGELGNLRFHRDGDPYDDVGSYGLHEPGGRIAIDKMPAIPANRIKRDFMHVAGRSATFDRSTAIRMAGARLYRYGEPMMDAIADFLWHDDRGRAWALWRQLQEWEADDKLYFCIDFRAEGSRTATDAVARSSKGDIDFAALRRRIDTYLPPQVTTVRVDAYGKLVTDEQLVAALDRPYFAPEPNSGNGASSDYQLTPNRWWAMDQLIPEAKWESACRTAFDAAGEFARSDLDLNTRCARAIARAERTGFQRLEQLRLRAASASGDLALAASREAEKEQFLLEALLQDIRQPALLVDAAQVIVLSGHTPFSGDIEEEEAVR